MPCLNSCWSLAIKEGTLENVSCPSVSCIKTRVSSHPREPSAAAGSPDGSESEKTDVDSDLVETVVGKELRRRWEQLRECRKAEIGEHSQPVAKRLLIRNKTHRTQSVLNPTVKPRFHRLPNPLLPTSSPLQPYPAVLSVSRKQFPKPHLHRNLSPCSLQQLRSMTAGRATAFVHRANTHSVCTARRHGMAHTRGARSRRRRSSSKST